MKKNKKNRTNATNAVVVMTATAPAPAAEEKDPAVELTEQVTEMTAKAATIQVRTQAEYEEAAKFLQGVKGLGKSVKDFWEPLRKEAKAAYDAVLADKKAMTTPLDTIEADIKGKMSAFTLEQERIRRAQEEAIRRLAAEEAERKFMEAAEAEARGDLNGAEMALTEAGVMEGASLTTTLPGTKVKAAGTSQTKTWRITGVDASLVPVTFSGVELRPVDTSAVLRLIKATKGNITIPGITFAEDVIIGVRA